MNAIKWMVVVSAICSLTLLPALAQPSPDAGTMIMSKVDVKSIDLSGKTGVVIVDAELSASGMPRPGRAKTPWKMIVGDAAYLRSKGVSEKLLKETPGIIVRGFAEAKPICVADDDARQVCEFYAIDATFPNGCTVPIGVPAYRTQAMIGGLDDCKP